MHLRKVLLAAVAVTLLAFSAGLRGQDFVDGIKVTLPQPVTVGDKVLQPGEYEIRRASQFQDQVLKIFSNDKMVYETNVITIPTEGKTTPEDSKVVLHHIGDNYYFDKMWIQGKDVGYEFPLPDKAKGLQRELAVTVPAKFESSTQSSEQVAQNTPATNDGPGLAAELDALAAQQDREQAALRKDETDIHHEQQAEVTPQAAPELTHGVTQQDRTDRVDQVAALQSEPSPAIPSGQSVAQPVPSQSQSNANAPEQLPATATNWLGFLLGGMLLIALSFVARPRMQE
jgi:hypothetical protein